MLKKVEFFLPGCPPLGRPLVSPPLDVGMVSRYQSNPKTLQWVAVKHIFKYLQRTRNYMFVYHSKNLIPIGYTYYDFPLD
jgi:hypothetical protein